MSTDATNPATDDYRRNALEEKRELFVEIRDDETLPDAIRYKYGQRPLEKLDELTEGETNE